MSDEKVHYLDEPTKCETHGFYSWIRACPYCEIEAKEKAVVTVIIKTTNAD